MMTSLVNPSTAYASGSESSVADAQNSEQTTVSYLTTTPSASSAVTIDTDDAGSSEGDGGSGQDYVGDISYSAPSDEGDTDGAGSTVTEEDTKSEDGSAADDPGTSSADGPADSTADPDSSTATDTDSSAAVDTDSSTVTDTDSSGIPDESVPADPGESEISVPALFLLFISTITVRLHPVHIAAITKPAKATASRLRLLRATRRLPRRSPVRWELRTRL